MNTSTIITATITALFLLAAFLWSLWRVRNARGFWRYAHLLIAALMLEGAAFVYLDLATYGIITGIALLLMSLAALLYDKSPGRWLAFVQLFSAILLAAGVPFVSG